VVGAPEPGFVAFVESRSTALLRTATLLCHGDSQAAEDLVQTALTKSYLAWGRIRRPESAEPYVRTLLVRTAIDRQRSRHHRAEHLDDGLPETPVRDADLAGLEHRLELWPYLAGLSSRQRAVVVLRYYEDLSEQQIAHVLGCSRGAVKTHTSHALAALRQALDVDGASTEQPRNSDA